MEKHEKENKHGRCIGVILAVITAIFFVLFAVMFFLTETAPSKLYKMLYPENPVLIQTGNTFYVAPKTGDYIVFGSYYNQPIVWKCILCEDLPVLQSSKILTFTSYDKTSSEWKNSSLRKMLNTGDPFNLNPFSELIKGETTLLSKNQLEKLPAADRRKQPTAAAIEHCNTRFLFVRKYAWYWTNSSIAGQTLCVSAVTQAGGFYKTPAYDTTVGVCPCVTLNDKLVVVCGGNGSENQPYVLSEPEKD
jgi:hypothetical protein